VPDGVCLEEPAEPELHTVGSDAHNVQQGTGTPRRGSARESQVAAHFLLTKETGLVKIRNRFILIIERVHDFFIGLCSPICWHESPKGANSCTREGRRPQLVGFQGINQSRDFWRSLTLRISSEKTNGEIDRANGRSGRLGYGS
jgi:hypothetical protein